MSTELIITIIIAVVGWGIAIWQTAINLKRNKEEAIRQRKFEAYNRFMVKCDNVFAKIRKTPQEVIGEMVVDSVKALANREATSEQVAEVVIGKGLVKMLKDITEPMFEVNTELSSLKLVASKEMLAMIEELQDLSKGLYQDFDILISQLTDKNGQEVLNMLEEHSGKSRAQRCAELEDAILKLMRKELGQDE